ncbi:MAG: cadherin-like beta sandwich domain-containing protein [Oscillospiraceae bacterium]|jgi:hypothetical protein|nr:cadherin-like beta sandwich domain-containing protein [Oscillospiraceae bacterium]
MRRIIKKLIALAAVLCLCTAFLPASFSASSVTYELTYEVLTDVTSARKGKEIVVSFKVTNHSAYVVSNAEFTLRYNNTLLQYKTAASTTGTYSASAAKNAGNSVGEIDVTFAANSLQTCYSANGSTTHDVQFVFTPIKAQATDTKVEFEIVKTTASCKKEYVSNNTKYDFDSAKIESKKASVTIPAASSDSTLKSMDFLVNNAVVPMTPSFSPTTTDYTVIIPYDNPGISYRLTLSDPIGASYSQTLPKSLAVGDNKFSFTVTAENGTQKTYTCTVRRLPLGTTVSSYLTTLSSNASSDTSSNSSSSEESSNTSSQASSEEPDESSEASSEEESSPVPSQDSPAESDSEGGEQSTAGIFPVVEVNLGVMFGIVLGAIALCAGAFSAGYMTHKSVLKDKRKYSKYSDDDDYEEVYEDNAVYDEDDDYEDDYEDDEYEDEEE